MKNKKLLALVALAATCLVGGLVACEPQEEPHEHAYTLEFTGDYKKTYFVGETFDATNLTVNKTCQCGESEVVTTYEYKTDALTLEDQSLTVTAGELTAQLAITVKTPEATELKVELKQGVVYYNNGLANPVPADFVVTAVYDDGSEVALTAEEYTVMPADKFYVNGGLIVVKYVANPEVVGAYNVEKLTELAVTKIEITKEPDKTAYVQGEVFNAEGMEVTATYNDGSTKLVNEYTFNQDALTMGTSSVEIVLGEVKTTQNITVTETEVAGVPTALTLKATPVISAGASFETFSFEVYAKMTNGNKELLDSSAYSLDMPSGTAKLGMQYSATLTLKENTKITLSTPILVEFKIEGEDTTVVGGVTKAEPEYVIVENGVEPSGKDVTFAGTFEKAVAAGTEASISFMITSYTNTKGDLTMRCGNSYLGHDDTGYFMNPLTVNHIVDITLNGKALTLGDDVVLKGCGPTETYAPVYGVYFDVVLKDVELTAGNNNVKISFKASTAGEKDYWGNAVSTMNVDYLTFVSAGTALTSNKVESIAIDQNVNVEYGTPFAEVVIPVVATMDNGEKVLLDTNEYNVEITKGDTSKGYVYFDEYTVKVTLKADNTKTAEYTKNVEKFSSTPTVTKVTLEKIGDKVYYTFYYNSIGNEFSAFELFDGQTVYALDTEASEMGVKTIVLRYDVTDVAVDTQFYAHMKLNGELLNHKSGDVILTGQTGMALANGKLFQIVTSYSIPTLKVTSFTGENYCEGAKLEQIGEKIYYTLTFTNNGKTIDQFELYDGTNVWAPDTAASEVTADKAILRYDITQKPAGTFYPHMNIAGVGYNNNSKGDLICGGTGKVTVGNTTYEIKIQWSMPTVVITVAE